MSISIKTVTSLLFVTFVIWYFLRRTTLGSAYAGDLWSIPQFFTSFFGVSVPIVREGYVTPGRESFRG